MNNNDVKKIENVIGYTFKNKLLLQQAFIRKSYAKEHGGEHNEVLEFIGDKVLDVKIVELLSYKYGSINSEQEYMNSFNEGKLTDLKRRLVEKKMLASRIDSLGLAKYLIMGNGDVEQGIKDSSSVKEDLFEAILGAVAIDSNFNYEKLDEVIKLMLDPEYYLDNNFDDSDNYVNIIQEWSLKKQGELPRYEYSSYYGGSWGCTLYLRPEGIDMLICGGTLMDFRGRGKSKAEARMNASKEAYKYLYDRKLLYSINDEIDNPCFELAINQLQELSQKGYFPSPEYDYEETYDDNGNPCWKCICKVKGRKQYWYSICSSKKQAKKRAAWSTLKDILGIEE